MPITDAFVAPTLKVPTVDDVRRATGQSVVVDDPRVETVYVFGSVARGEATDDSDVDVIVVIADDTSSDEYRQLDRILHDHFGDSTGCSVDLILRRRSEFDHMVSNVSASVEHYVMSDAVRVYETDDRSVPSGNIGEMPRNNLALALNDATTMTSCLAALDAWIIGIPSVEAQSKVAGDSQADIDRATATPRAARYRSLLQDSHMVIEQALRATAAAVDNKSLGKGHELDKLLPEMSDTPEKQALSDVIDTLRGEDGKTRTWRFVVYVATKPEWAREITAGNALKHVSAATACGRLVSDTLEEHASNEPDLHNVVSELNCGLDTLDLTLRGSGDLETGMQPQPALDAVQGKRWRQRRQERKQQRLLLKKRRNAQKQQQTQTPAEFPKPTPLQRGKRCGAPTSTGDACRHWVTTGRECPAGHKRT